MPELKIGLLAMAGLLFFNVILSAYLWANNPTPIYRNLFFIWALGVLDLIMGGLVQSERWMAFGAGIPVFFMNVTMADLFRRTLHLPCKWKRHTVLFGISAVISLIAAILNAHFWIIAFPLSAFAALPLFDVVYRAMRTGIGNLPPAARIAIFCALLYAIHILDYPFLRTNPDFVVTGHVLGILTVFALSVTFPMIILEDALRSRDEFLTIAAHEIRGPITSLNLGVQGLQTGDLPAEAQSQFFAAIERSTRRLAWFVDELLELGEMRAGRFKLNPQERIDLSEVVRQVAAEMDTDLKSAGSHLSVSANGPAVGHWDADRLRQIVRHLLSNAAKFGKGQPIHVSVLSEGDKAKLVVADAGIGISRELQERVFEPFERGVSIRHYGGLGLGLNLAQRAVTAMGGSIYIQSAPGLGSTFSIELPLGDT